MQKPDFGHIAVREVVIIASCIATAFGIGRFGAVIPGIGKKFFSIKLAALLYVASIACRMAGFFMRMTFAVAIVLGLIAIALIVLAARYPAAFAFPKG